MIPQIIVSVLMAIGLVSATSESKDVFAGRVLGTIITVILLAWGGFYQCWGIG